MTFVYTPPEPDTYCFDANENKDVWSYSKELLLAEVERVRRETVEACAKVCYTIKETGWDHSSPPGQYETTASQAVECARKIKELLK